MKQNCLNITPRLGPHINARGPCISPTLACTSDSRRLRADHRISTAFGGDLPSDPPPIYLLMLTIWCSLISRIYAFEIFFPLLTSSLAFHLGVTIPRTVIYITPYHDSRIPSPSRRNVVPRFCSFIVALVRTRCLYTYTCVDVFRIPDVQVHPPIAHRTVK